MTGRMFNVLTVCDGAAGEGTSLDRASLTAMVRKIGQTDDAPMFRASVA